MRTPAALQLDFRRAAPPRWRGLGWGLLALAALLSLGVAEHYADVLQRHDAAQARHDLLGERQRARTPRRASAAVDTQTLAEVERANAVIDQLAVPWEALFAVVEGIDARGLAVLSLLPNARERSLRLTGEARTMPELLAYVTRLADQPVLEGVHLQGYNTVVRDGVPVLAFTLAAHWRQQP